MAQRSGIGSGEWPEGAVSEAGNGFPAPVGSARCSAMDFVLDPGPYSGIISRLVIVLSLSLPISLRVHPGGSSILVGPFVLDVITGVLIPNNIGYVV
jgi:hypothetical protein